MAYDTFGPRIACIYVQQYLAPWTSDRKGKVQFFLCSISIHAFHKKIAQFSSTFTGALLAIPISTLEATKRLQRLSITRVFN